MTAFAHSLLWVARAAWLDRMTREYPGLTGLALGLSDVGGPIPKAALAAQAKRARRAEKRRPSTSREVLDQIQARVCVIAGDLLPMASFCDPKALKWIPCAAPTSGNTEFSFDVPQVEVFRIPPSRKKDRGRKRRERNLSALEVR